jgi:putative phosphoribosyl transferase
MPLWRITLPHHEGKLVADVQSPPGLKGFVIFAHGSGSSRLSPRNRAVADQLNLAGIGTVLIDLLTEEEALDRDRVFDIPFLAERLVHTTREFRLHQKEGQLPIGYFGASTGGGAALWAAALMGNEIAGVVSRGGRPDLAEPMLSKVTAPTLLIVGERDELVISMNQRALGLLPHAKLRLIAGASHLFEEPGTLDLVGQEASIWFVQCFREYSRKATE